MQRRFPLSVNVLLRACKKFLMRFCRRTGAAAIAGPDRKRGCAAPPPRIVCQIGSGTKGKEAVIGHSAAWRVAANKLILWDGERPGAGDLLK